MDNDLFSYIERLQVMVFFAGYPLVYAIVQFIAGNQRKKPSAFTKRWVKSLPFAYALTGTLFLGLVLKNMFPDFTMKSIAEQFHYPYLKIWGLLAVLFWIPAFSKKPVFSLLHSLVFFFLLLKDLFINTVSSTGSEVVKNDMKIYTDSVLLNTGTLAVILIMQFVIHNISDRKTVSSN